MADPKLTIVIEQKGADGVVKSLKTIQKQGDVTTTSLIKDNKLVSESTRTVIGAHKNHYAAITAISTGYLAASQAYGIAKGALDDLITKGIEDERSIARRDTALKHAGDTTGTYTKKLEAQAQNYLKSYGLADEYTRSIQAQLGVMGVSKENIERLTTASIGLAEKQGIDGVNAAKILARFTEGYTNTVRGADLKVNAHVGTQERVRQAMDKTKVGIDILNKRMSDPEGNIQKGRAKWEEVQEQLGKKLLPVVSSLAQGLGKFLDWYNALDPKAQNFVLFAGAAVVAIKPLMDSINALVTGVKFLAGSSLIKGAGKLLATPAGGIAAAAATVLIPGSSSNTPAAQQQTQEFLHQLYPNDYPIVKVKAHEDWGLPSSYTMPSDPSWAYAAQHPVDQYGKPMAGYGGGATGGGNGRGFPEWWKSHGNDYTQVGQGFIGGGMSGGLSAAGSLAGNAVLPGIGGLLGGLLGGGLGKLFGGHHRQRGETPGHPVYTEDVRVSNLLTDFLNATKLLLLRGAGAGIDNAVKAVGMQNSRAGI